MIGRITGSLLRIERLEATIEKREATIERLQQQLDQERDRALPAPVANAQNAHFGELASMIEVLAVNLGKPIDEAAIRKRRDLKTRLFAAL